MLIGVLVGLTACGYSPQNAVRPTRVPPPPCVGNDTVYGLADQARGVQPAQPTGIVLPPSELRGTVDVMMIVDARGHVEPNDIGLSVVGGRDLSSRVAAAMRERVAGYSFYPAVFHGCAVRFLYQVRISKE